MNFPRLVKARLVIEPGQFLQISLHTLCAISNVHLSTLLTGDKTLVACSSCFIHLICPRHSHTQKLAPHTFIFHFLFRTLFLSTHLSFPRQQVFLLSSTLIISKPLFHFHSRKDKSSFDFLILSLSHYTFSAHSLRREPPKIPQKISLQQDYQTCND